MFTAKDVSFIVNNVSVAGVLYMPEINTGSYNVPGLVLCHGFACTKEILLPAYAEKFASKGYAVLIFDYRGFGASGGETGRLVPRLQIEDIKCAISFLSSIDGVDSKRIGLWGTSYGGANAIVTASEDERVKCLCVQVTFGNGERVITGKMSYEEVTKFKATLLNMRAKKEATGREMMVQLSKILTDEQSKIFFSENIEKFPALQIKIPFLTVFENMNHKPEDCLSRVHVPIFIVGAENDIVNPIEETRSLYDLAFAPKEMFIVPNVGHFDVYNGNIFEQVSDKQLAWFDRYL